MKHLFANILVLVTFLFFVNISFSQYPPQGSQPIPPKGQDGLKAHIYGKVVDEKNVAMDYATVVVMKAEAVEGDSVIYKGVKTDMTNSIGEFNFTDITPAPKMIVRIAPFGYAIKDIPLNYNRDNIVMGVMQFDLGRIKMELEESEELKEVTITAKKPLMVLEADKRVFDVTKDEMAQGGTAIDVMKNVPGVNVDIDGNVQVRNSTPQIYIDGRPTTLTLDQIPADDIEKVEVMTNPSAKYDASGGTSGIINIILKKNIKTGYNGSLRAGMDSRLGFNAGGDINYRRDKINVSASLNYRNGRGISTGEVLRENYRENSDTIDNIMTQKDLSKNRGGGFFGKVGLDYLPTNKTSFSLKGSVWRGAFTNYSVSDINTDSVYAEAPELYYYQRNSESSRKMLHYSAQLGFKQLFKRVGEALTVDLSYNNGSAKTNAEYISEYHITDINSPFSRETQQKVIGGGNRYNAVAQADYVVPLDVFTIETGLRAQYSGRKNINDNYYMINDEFQLIPNPASNYSNIDQIYAAYISFSKQYNKFGYKAGLRAESSNYKGKLDDTGEEFKIQYPISLFPSAFLSYKLTDKQDLQLNYSRRVDRPRFWQILPFVDSVDVFNIRKGNPALKPQFTNNIELQYLNNFSRKYSLLASVYYKYTDNLITRYIEQGENGTLINTYVNANSSYATGLELISNNQITNWLDIMASVDVYNSKINSDAYDSWSTKSRWAMFGKINVTFKMPYDWSAQLGAIYQSKSALPSSEGSQGWGPHSTVQSTSQGYIDAFWALDASLKKSFLNRKLSVTLAVSDIFGTRRSRSISQSDFFYQDYNRISNPYMVRLNLVWTFGKMDVDLFRRLSKGTGDSVMSE